MRRERCANKLHMNVSAPNHEFILDPKNMILSPMQPFITRGVVAGRRGLRAKSVRDFETCVDKRSSAPQRTTMLPKLTPALDSPHPTRLRRATFSREREKDYAQRFQSP